jgi:ABC-2 type transport system permease protein
MNIFRHEFRAHRTGLIWWSVGMLFMTYAGMAKFGGFKAAGPAALDIFKTLPKSVLAVFGIGNIDLTSAAGFFTVLFIYLFVMAAIHATLLGAGILTEEELDRTAEFLYPKPVSRVRVVAEKALAAVTSVVILNIVAAVSSVIFVALYNKGGPPATKPILLMMAGMLLAQLLFLSIGMAAAAVLKNPKAAGPVASAYMFTAFFLKLGLDITDKYQWLRFLTPFRYYDAVTILKASALDWGYVALSIGLIALFTGVTFYYYRLRDLYV